MKDSFGLKNSPLHNKKAILDILDKLNPSQMSEVVEQLNQIHENSHCFSREYGYYWCKFDGEWGIYRWTGKWTDSAYFYIYEDSVFEEIDECKIVREPLDKVTRVEVIDENGRSYSNWDEMNIVNMMLQDDQQTLKLFIKR